MLALFSKKNNQVLLVKRTNTDWASGQWNFPGGLLKKMRRSLQQRHAKRMRNWHHYFSIRFELVHVMQVHKTKTHNKDILGFYFYSTTWEGTAFNKEPERHSEIGWFNIDNLPTAITEHALQALNGLRSKQYYSIH